MELKFLDLFAGCGGLSDGFKLAGEYRLLASVEWEKVPCEVLKQRLRTRWEYQNTEDIVLQFDIQRTEELLNGWHDDEIYGSHKGLVKTIGDLTTDIIIGGPPCQAYSVAGRVRDAFGMQFDYRNFLFESYIKIVNHFKPKLFIFENVPGIFSAKPGGTSIIERIHKGFSEIGYDIVNDLQKHALIDFSDYNIPQSRKRVIILGIRKDIFPKDTQTYLNIFYHEILAQYRSNCKKTVHDAISDLPKFKPIEQPVKLSGRRYSHLPAQTAISNHEPRFHSNRDIDIFRELALDIMNHKYKYSNADALKLLYTERTGKTSSVHKYQVLRWDKPSNTIPAHLFKDGLRHIHPDPEQARSITVREAARLQAFDDDFLFNSSMTENYKMIGNAVPPGFAKILGRAIHTFAELYL